MQENSDIDITLSSSNYTGLSKAGKDILALISSEVPEVLEPTSDSVDGLPQVEVAIDRQKAYSFGISVSTIATEITGRREGLRLHHLPEGRRSARRESQAAGGGPAEDPRSQQDIRPRIERTEGPALANFAELKKGVGPVEIHRTTQQRSVEITGSLAPGNQANIVEAKIKSSHQGEAQHPLRCLRELRGLLVRSRGDGERVRRHRHPGPAPRLLRHGRPIRVLQGPA